MITKLTFVNNATDLGQATVIIFQRNIAVSGQKKDVVWHQIQRCRVGWSHPIDFPHFLHVSTSDEFGNFSPKLHCDEQHIFDVKPNVVGRSLTACRARPATKEIIVTNRLARGALNINIFRGQRVVARHEALAPEQAAHFRFEPALWIGLAGPCPSYEFVPRVRAVACATRLFIRNIISADIIMSVGNTIHEPLRFELANINSGQV